MVTAELLSSQRSRGLCLRFAKRYSFLGHSQYMLYVDFRDDNEYQQGLD